jgi:hypothetical protein
MRHAKSNSAKNHFDSHEDEGVGHESMRDSLESSEISSDAFSSRFQQRNNFNQITQYIQNNNNKITIIIKHDNNNDGPQQQQPEQNITPQVIYIQPASSQPNLHANRLDVANNENVYNSLDDLDDDEHYQFYNESAIDVPEDFKGNSYLVLNFNDAANKRLKRRICTPTRNLRPPIDDEEFMMKNRGKKSNNWMFGSKEDNRKIIVKDDGIKVSL